MNNEKNKGMDVILTNLKNWQENKKDTALMMELLIKANSFKICYNVSYDSSEFFHLYPALEQNEKEQNFNLIIYMISENRDTKEFIEKNWDDADQFIKKYQISTDFTNPCSKENPLTLETEISIEEAQLRKSRWSSEISNWLIQNDIFEVFELPSVDFNFESNIALEGQFGIKEANEMDNNKIAISTYVPDIMIYQTNSDTGTISVFDMAKLSPPYGKGKRKYELINLIS